MCVSLRSISVLLLAIPAAQSVAQNDPGIPSAVVEYWTSLIGDWDIDGRIGSTPVTGSASFEWAGGKHCYLGRQVWKVGENGRSVHLTLIGGWDAREKETIEQGFSSTGSAATVHYRPPAEKTSAIEGSIDGADGTGAPWSGTLELERNGPDEFQLTTNVDGEVVHSLKYVRKKDAE